MPKGPVKTAYVLLFRGVGGATQLPAAALREALTEAGFEGVATYINSGNAVLRSHLSREKVINSVVEICQARFGFTKAILAPTLEEWSALIGNNPFPLVRPDRGPAGTVLPPASPRPDGRRGLGAAPARQMPDHRWAQLSGGAPLRVRPGPQPPGDLRRYGRLPHA